MPEPVPERPASAPLLVVGALHVDELLRPLAPLVARASNPVRRERRPGGVGANVARGAARAGDRDVVLVAALGDDADAAWLCASLAADGVRVHGCTVAGCRSGRYTVVHDERGELFVGLAETDAAEALDAEAARARFPGPPLAALVLDANLDGDCIASLLAGEPDDTAPRIALAVSPAKSRRLSPHLAALDLLFCNRREAAALGERDPADGIDVLGDTLARAGCPSFVLSDGPAAVLVQTPDGRVHVPVPSIAVNGSVNGAGDALAGAALARWLDGAPLADAVRDAGLPAAIAVVRGDTSLAPPAPARDAAPSPFTTTDEKPP